MNKGQFKKGHISYTKGKKLPPCSDETKKLISKNRTGKGLGYTFNKGRTPWNKNKKCPGIGGRKPGGTSWTKGMFGIDHPCYKEIKKAPFYKLIRRTYKYRQWRSDIFTRDNFTCQGCGLKGVYLEAHHIKRFIDIIEEYKIETLEEAFNCEELWNMNNGITLCNECHRQTDTWGRRKVI